MISAQEPAQHPEPGLLELLHQARQWSLALIQPPSHRVTPLYSFVHTCTNQHEICPTEVPLQIFNTVFHHYVLQDQRSIDFELSTKSKLSQGLLADQCINCYLKFFSYPEHLDRERTTIGGTHVVFCILYILKSFSFHLASSLWSSIPSKNEKLIIND